MAFYVSAFIYSQLSDPNEVIKFQKFVKISQIVLKIIPTSALNITQHF